MKTTSPWSSFKGIAVIGMLLCSVAISAQAKPSAFITGSISYARPLDGASISIDFQVVQEADGTVRGEIHNSGRFGNDLLFIAHVRIDCLHFLDDNTVLLTGIDVWDTDPVYLGETAAFIVRDNGQGAFAPVDASTGVYFGNEVGFPLTCESALELIESGAYDLEADLESKPALTGNIQVKQG